VWKEAMTHAERKALREKHQPKPWSKDNPYCRDCGIKSDYPCDVIKILDAYEEFIVPLKEKQ
jgi:hypothetical protein